MNRNNEVTLVVADAFVMYYDNILTKWIASGLSKSVTIAKVQLLQNVVSNQFRIFAWNPINKEVLVNSILYHNLRYQKAHATFHEWRDSDTQIVYGLHFADTKDASLFGDIISKVFKSLELIYQQCRELQAQIRSTSATDQYNQPSLSIEQPKLVSCNSMNSEHFANSKSFDFIGNYSSQPNDQTCHYSQVIKSGPLSNLKSLNIVETHDMSFVDANNSETEAQSPHNYENINSILLKHTAMKSISMAPDNVESSNKCQSSSDDSVRGLKRQPSSTSSGYATVASMTEQYSPTPGLTSSFSMVAEALNKCISDSVIKNQCSADYSSGFTCQTDTPVTDSTPSSFASQLQSMIQLRKVNQTSPRNDTSHVNPNTLKNNNPFRCSDGLSAPSPPLKDSLSFVDPRSSCSSKIIPADDIMSEMKMKLQRRKQLIDGHTDPNYSSSTDKSDVCSSNASDNGSFASNIDQAIDKKLSPKKITQQFEKSNTKTTSEMSNDNKTLIEDGEKFNQQAEDFRNASDKKKMFTGDIIQNTTTIAKLATKQDLEQIKKEITEDFRRELMEAKKEVLIAIRLLKKTS